MHRSGTSWLAGSLQELGLDLGEVSQSDPHNRRGNRESPVLMELHEAVLRENDGSWKRPAHPNRWSPERSAQLAEFIAGMDARGHGWGFKDPRALLLFDEWRRQLGDRLRLIGIFRHPLAVHGSLHARNPRFTEGRSVKLWKAYNERLVAEHRAGSFPLLRFDVPPPELNATFVAATDAVGIPSGGRTSFYDESLVHNNEAAARSVPWTCRKLWSYLCAEALTA
jgi:hypothetical protein